MEKSVIIVGGIGKSGLAKTIADKFHPNEVVTLSFDQESTPDDIWNMAGSIKLVVVEDISSVDEIESLFNFVDSGKLLCLVCGSGVTACNVAFTGRSFLDRFDIYDIDLLRDEVSEVFKGPLSPVKSKGFIISYFGDESVGIFPQQWQISGDFTFDSEAEFSGFKFKISQSFEFCSDTPILVESIEERHTRINKEVSAIPGAYHCE